MPGKTFLPLGEKPLYRWTIDALSALDLSDVIVATSDEASDDMLSEQLQSINVNVFRGPKSDIAKRAILCCQEYELDHFLRVNGDSPFQNLTLLKEGIEKIEKGTEFVTNLYPRNYPYGISCEIIQTKRFKELYTYFSEDEKEHITKYYYSNIEAIKYSSCNVLDQDISDVRLTIDTAEDYAKMQYFLSQSKLDDFHSQSILELVKNYKEIIDDKFIFDKA